MALLNYSEPFVGLEAPDTDVIRDQVAADWIDAFNTNDGSPALDTSAATPAGQLVDAETSYIAQANSELLYLASQFDPRKAEGIFQDALAAIYFLTRKVAQKTRVECTCTGLAGTDIPIGALAQDSNGVKYQAINTNPNATLAATIPLGGSVSVTFEALEAGAIQCDANTLNSIITVIAGWDTINNPTAGSTGWLQETQADFEQRRFASVAHNAHGSVLAIQGALNNLADVTDCVVLENDTSATKLISDINIPSHSVAIIIYGGDDDAIAETIYNKKSAGCGTTGTTTSGGGTAITGTTVSYTEPDTNAIYTYNIIRPTTQAVTIEVTIDYMTSLNASYINDIKTAILADFNGTNTDSWNTRVTMGQTVYASRFSTAVLTTAQVPSLYSITIGLNGGAQSNVINVPAYVMPTLSSNDITVVVNP